MAKTTDEPGLEMTRPFRFGVQSYSASSAQDWRDQARRAEDHGFSTFSVADHVIGPGPALSRHQSSGAGRRRRAGDGGRDRGDQHDQGRCSRVLRRLPPAGRCSPRRWRRSTSSPTGDSNSASAPGGSSAEYEAMGVPWDRAGVRLDRLEETIALLRAHFGDGLVDVSGRTRHTPQGSRVCPSLPTVPRRS